MKKLLSLLALLVTTLSAFALDFTDYRKVTLGSNTPTESNDAKLSVTDNGDGTYNVTFNDIINKDGSYTDKYGTFTFSNVSGSTSGDVTTVTGTNLTGTVSGGTYGIKSFTDGELSLKFKDGKAYAIMTATCKIYYRNYTFNVVFGTDEGFDGGSTGGGETGGETSSIVTVKENFQSTQGSSWGENVTIDWNTQKLVVSVNLASTGSDKGFLGVTKKGQTAGWNNSGIIFYNTNGSTVQGYAPGQPNNANTNQVTKGEDPVRFEISKDGGVKCQGNVVISASNIAHLTNQSEIVVGAADKPAGALYNYIKVVPLDWKETTEPEVTVVATKKFNDVDYSNTWSQAGTANVTFEEMSDETVKMKFTTDGINISADALTKGTDDKGRTTYTGEAVNDAMSTITYTIKAVVYTEGTAEKLYMTMEANSGVTFNVGVDPDYVAPVTYKNTLYVVENAKLLLETPEAEVVLKDKGDNKYDVTLPAFTAGGMNVPSITFEATKVDNKLTASNVSVADVYSGEAAVVTMDGTFEADGKLFASLTVKCGEWFDYEVGYGIKPFVATTKEYTAEWANVKVGDAEPVNFQNAKADYTEFAKGQYSLTFKDLTFGEKKIGDFTIKYVSVDGEGKLSTTAAAGTWTRVEAGQDVASQGAEASISGFEGVIGGTGDSTLKVKFTIASYGTVAVDFGHKYEAPEPPVAPEVVDVVDADYNPAGQSWQKNDVSIDWDKQYIVAKLDLSTCKTGGAGPENVLAVGTDLTGWNNGPHYFFYYNKADKVLQYNYLHSANKSMNGGYANLSKAYIQLTDEIVTIELSKKGGLKVNGESALVKYIPSATNPSNNSTESWTTSDLETVFSGLWNLSSIGFGGCQGSTMSNATYKYVKVVPLGWTETTEPETPEVTEKKTYNEKLYVVIGTTSTQPVDATVEVKEMSDKSINMSLKYSEYEYTSTDLKKGTDAKERTTYTGTISNGTQTFDVAGVVYQKDNVDRLYMTMTKESMKVVVGEDPDATPEAKPVVYKNTLKVVRGDDNKEYVDAEVSVLDKGEGIYEITLPMFSDMDGVPGEVGPVMFQANGVEEDGKVVLTATDKAFTLTNTGWKNSIAYVSMKGEIADGNLKATFNVNIDNNSKYKYTLYYGVEAPKPEVTVKEEKTFTDAFSLNNTSLGSATVTIKEMTDETIKMVFTFSTNNFESSDITKGTDEKNRTTYKGHITIGNVVCDVNGVVYTKDDAEKLYMTFANADNGTYVFGTEPTDTPKPPVEPTFPMENYQADGKGFVVSTDIDWSKQKFQAIIDATKCSAANTEDIFGFGEEATAWFKNIHVYADKGSYKAYFQPAAGKDNNNTTVTITDQSNITIEVSKAEGLTVDGVVVIAAEQLTGIFDLTTVKFGSGENSQYSNALYKSVKLVDLPKDPETGINAINAAAANGEAQLFTVNGVKLNKLQKGLNIVRTADGKVKKVLVK